MNLNKKYIMVSYLIIILKSLDLYPSFPDLCFDCPYGGEWFEIGGALDMTGQYNGDQDGYSVAISSDGTIVIIGAPGYASNEGYARIFQYDSGTNSWSGIATSIIGNLGNKFGSNVALNGTGNIVAIGTSSSSNNHYVKTFIYTGTSLSGIGQQLTGDTVALNQAGDIIAVGYPGFNSSAGE